MTHASVFSGIGGPEVAAAMLGWENLFHCEINPFGRAVLQYWFPNAKSYEDITKTDFSEWGGKVNVLTGGFPCQPFSYAGQRRGADDDRYLWPFMHRCINQVRPDWVVCENVAGILTMVEQGDVTEMAAEKSLFDEGDTLYRYRLDETFTLERICNDLERDGYAVQAVIIPACAVNAPHRRDRVFIIGHRIVAETDNGANGRTARKHEGKGGEERLQERHEVRQFDQPTQVRPTGADDAENTMCSGQLHGQHDIAGSERNIGDACTGNCERVCGETSGVCIPDPIRTGLEGQDQPRCGEGGQRVYLRRGPARCHRQDDQERTTATDTESQQGGRLRPEQPECGEPQQGELGGRNQQDGRGGYAPHTRCTGLEELQQLTSDMGKEDCRRQAGGHCDGGVQGREFNHWAYFPTVSPVHRGNDGIPFPLDDLTISPSKWRTESLKAYGNAIVPQVMYEIFRAIEETYK